MASAVWFAGWRAPGVRLVGRSAAVPFTRRVATASGMPFVSRASGVPFVSSASGMPFVRRGAPSMPAGASVRFARASAAVRASGPAVPGDPSTGAWDRSVRDCLRRRGDERRVRRDHRVGRRRGAHMRARAYTDVRHVDRPARGRRVVPPPGLEAIATSA